MARLKCVAAALTLAFAFAGAAAAQDTPPAQPAASQWSLAGIEVSGLIDAYYSLNFNHPASRVNQLRNFDVKGNDISLNMAKLTLERAPAPLGFRVDLGFGRTFEIVHGAEPGPSGLRYVEQAYFSFKPEGARGLQVDFGKFVTSAGAEVIETHSNWNYSRSLLLALAIPYYHFGLRANMPVAGPFSAGVQLVNGWNNVEDNNNGKTVGVTGAITTNKFTWTNNYYVGPEKADDLKGLRQVYDTTLLMTPNPRTQFYVNFDYGVDRLQGVGSSRWVGVAGAARVAVSPWFALAPRLEWFNDADGFATGTVQKLKEATLTAEFRMTEGLLSRLEYRRDWSNTAFFDRGATPGVFRNQDTVLLGLVAYFGAKR